VREETRSFRTGGSQRRTMAPFLSGRTSTRSPDNAEIVAAVEDAVRATATAAVVEPRCTSSLTTTARALQRAPRRGRRVAGQVVGDFVANYAAAASELGLLTLYDRHRRAAGDHRRHLDHAADRRDDRRGARYLARPDSRSSARGARGTRSGTSCCSTSCSTWTRSGDSRRPSPERSRSSWRGHQARSGGRHRGRDLRRADILSRRPADRAGAAAAHGRGQAGAFVVRTARSARSSSTCST